VKVFAPCMVCQKELGHPSFEPIFVEYFDDRVGRLTCQRGHDSVILLQSQKFEVLMESGVNALEQGFTLEACSSFAAAVERAIEFALRVLCTVQGMPPETWAKTFGEMSRQSERQLGAFMISHALAFGTPYRPNSGFQDRRNRVIHKGEILNAEQSHKFCEDAYDQIVALITKLKGAYPEQLRQTVSQDLTERASKVRPSETATTTGTFFYNLANAAEPPPFATAVAKYHEGQKSLQEAVPHMEAMAKAVHAAAALQHGGNPLPSASAG